MSRVLLGIIDHNSHVDRPYKLKPDRTLQYHRVWRRRSNRWDTIPVKEKKQYTYIAELLMLILKHRTQHALSLRNIKGRKRYGSSITPEAPPETATIAASKKSRFGTSWTMDLYVILHNNHILLSRQHILCEIGVNLIMMEWWLATHD